MPFYQEYAFRQDGVESKGWNADCRTSECGLTNGASENALEERSRLTWDTAPGYSSRLARGGVTPANLENDHFMRGKPLDITTVALAITAIRWLEYPDRALVQGPRS
jgi:hypothetical protein